MAPSSTPTIVLSGAPLARPAIAESPVHRTVGAGILSMLSLALKVGGNLITIPLALKFLGKEEYGFFVVLQSFATYFALSELGIGQSVLNFQNVAYARKDYGEVNRVLSTTFVLYCLVVLPIWLLFLPVIFTQPVADWFLRNPSPALEALFKPYLLVTATLALLRVPLVVFPVTLMGIRELALRQWVEVANGAFLLLGTVTTLFLGGRVLALVIATNLGLLILACSAYPLVRVRHPQVEIGSRFVSRRLLPVIFGNSIFFFLYNLGLLFQRLVGNLLAAKFGSLTQVSELFVLLTVFRVVGWSIADSLSSTLQPYIILFSVRGDSSRTVFFTRLSTKITFAFAVVLSTVVWLLSDALIRVWLGPGMFVGYGPLAFLALSFLIDVLFLPANNFMRSLNQHRALSFCMLAYAVLSLALGIAGARAMAEAPIFGLCAGLLAASVLAQGLVLPFLVRRWLQLPWREYARDFLARPMLLTVVALPVLLAIGKPEMVAPATRLVAAFAFAAALAAIAWFAVLEREERAWLSAVLKRLSLPQLPEAAN